MTRIYVAIDPGLYGAVAVVGHNGKFLGLFDTPITQIKRGKKNRRVYLAASMAAIIRRVIDKYKLQSIKVCLEQVNAMPGEGAVGAFTFGRGVGLWEGIAAGLGLPIESVTSQVWKKAILKKPGKDKGASILKAQQLFPAAAEKLTRKRDDGRADALLIAEYFRRQAVGEHNGNISQ